MQTTRCIDIIEFFASPEIDPMTLPIYHKTSFEYHFHDDTMIEKMKNWCATKLSSTTKFMAKIVFKDYGCGWRFSNATYIIRFETHVDFFLFKTTW
jgi:formylmethanofuran dehydrogenase subunit A